MSRSQGTQSLFRAWINGSWLDFGGLPRCFCLLWHPPPTPHPHPCFVRSPCTRLTKAPPPWKRGRQKRGDRNRGRGSLREDVKAAAFLRHVVFFRACCGAHLCFYVLILHVCGFFLFIPLFSRSRRIINWKKNMVIETSAQDGDSIVSEGSLY